MYVLFEMHRDAIPVVDGYVALPESPGIGFEEKAALYAVMRELGA